MDTTFRIDLNGDGDTIKVDITELSNMYEEHVDRDKYPTFEQWKYDMIKAGMLTID